MTQVDSFRLLSHNGKLLLLALLATSPALAQQAPHPTLSQFYRGWHAAGNDNSFSGAIHSLSAAVPHSSAFSTNGGLSAGGAFTAPGARLTRNANPGGLFGGSWQGLNSGLNGTVLAIAQTENGDSLFVGGSFTRADTIAVQNIALWTGGAWHALGAGTNLPVRALALRKGQLYVGGQFTQAGGVAANHIASWKKNTGWTALGTGVNAPVNAIVFQGNAGSGQSVYVGGEFTQAGGQPASYVALWGTGWQALGAGLNGPVLALNNFSGPLVVGGSFTQAGGQPARNLAQYNTSSATNPIWQEIGGGTNLPVRALASAGMLIVGGDFTEVGGAPAAHIAAYNVGWYRLDSGLNGTVRALATYNHELYVGGDFQSLGDSSQAYPYFARYAGNRGPEEPVLSNSTVRENLPIGTIVGTFGKLANGTSAPADLDGDLVTYSLVSGAGSQDNGRFTIASNGITMADLQTADSLDYEAQSTYSIRVRIEDMHGAQREKEFIIGATDGPDNLTVANQQTLSGGAYLKLVVLPTGALTVTAPISVETTLRVASGGTLATSGNIVTGPGSFVLENGATLGIGSAEGISSSGSTGDIQVSGARTYNVGATYEYVDAAGAAARQTAVTRYTGTGLPARVARLAQRATADVTLTQPVEVADELLLAGSGHLQLNGLTLKLPSSATGTAQLLNTGAGRVVGTTAQAQRYLDASVNSGLGYRQLSAPVAAATVASLGTSTFTPVVNAAYNTSASPGLVTPFPTVFGYDESRLPTVTSNYSAFDKGWYSPASLADLLTVGRGYTVDVSGGETITFTGTLNQDNLTLPLARTDQSVNGGWQLLGNPFPSSFDWQQVAVADRPGLDGAVCLSQSTGRYVGQYRSFVNGVGGQQLLASGQGFFARVADNASTATLMLRNAARVSAGSTLVQRGAETRPLLALELVTTQPAALRDVLYVYAQPGATAGFDNQLDAAKLPNGTGLNLAALTSNGQGLSIQGLPLLSGRVPLSVQVPATGTYRLEVAELLNLPAGTAVELEDTQTGLRTPLTNSASAYAFAAQAGQSLAGRFWLNLTGATPLAATGGTLQAALSLYPNPASEAATLLLPIGTAPGYVRVVDGLGRVVREQALTSGATTLKLAGLPKGVYAVQVQAGAERATRRLAID